jgi:hypothetical protein
MNRKEWREVGQQSLYFLLALAVMALLLGGVDLLMGAMGFAQSKPLEGEKLIIILGAWWLMFSMFLGLSPFAMDSKQKGLEYLLTLPYSRRRLLLIKLLPRLAAVILFYLAFALLYSSIGSDAFGGGFTLFSLAYFALFLISFSLSLVYENFIVQSIWAGIALCGHLALSLCIVWLGFSWKFKMPASWVGSGFWHDLSIDVPTLLISIAVFLIMAAPFIVSFFLAFKKFDLKPVRAFNRRQLLIFLPLLLMAFASSLGVTYLVQKNASFWDAHFFLLKNQRLLKAEFPGKLTLYNEAGRRKVDTRSRIFWERLLLEQGERLYMSGYDTENGERIIGCLNQFDFSWKILHRAPERSFVANGYLSIRYNGEDFVYLRRSPAEAGHSGKVSKQVARSDVLELVRVDPAGGESRTITFRDPLFRKYSEPWIIGSGERNGERFWIIASRWQNVFRLWGDGRVEDLGVSKGLPAYAANLLFTRSDHSLVVRRLLDAGSETIKEIEGNFSTFNPYFSCLISKPVDGIYTKRDNRIVGIDLSTLNVEDVGPDRGHIWTVPPGVFYYVEFETWPVRNTDKWKKLYRLQGGRMVFLKQFDFGDAGYGNVEVNGNGVILWQHKIVNQKNSKITMRVFAFPDLRELRFKGLD